MFRKFVSWIVPSSATDPAEKSVKLWNDGSCNWGGTIAYTAVRCPPGMWMVGLRGRGGKWNDAQDTIECQTLAQLVSKSADRTLVGIKANGNSYIGAPPGRGSGVRLVLPAGTAVNSLYGWAQGYVDKLAIAGKDPFALTEQQASGWLGSNESEWHSATCPPNYFTVGLELWGNMDWEGGVVTMTNICRDKTPEIIEFVAGADMPLDIVDKCLGKTPYAYGEKAFDAAACEQVNLHFVVSSRERLLRAQTTPFQSTHREFCDTAYNLLCGNINNEPDASLRDKQICACNYVVPAFRNTPGYIPACHNNDCIAAGVAYKTAGQQAQSCGNLVICIQNLLLQNVNSAEISQVAVTNQCSSNTPAVTTQTPAAALPAPPATNNNTPPATNNNDTTPPATNNNDTTPPATNNNDTTPPATNNNTPPATNKTQPKATKATTTSSFTPQKVKTLVGAVAGLFVIGGTVHSFTKHRKPSSQVNS